VVARGQRNAVPIGAKKRRKLLGRLDQCGSGGDGGETRPDDTEPLAEIVDSGVAENRGREDVFIDAVSQMKGKIHPSLKEDVFRAGLGVPWTVKVFA
jgi:hypothetical protein